MNCTNCGARVDDKDKFCPVCGNALHETENGQNQGQYQPQMGQMGQNQPYPNQATYQPTLPNQNSIENKPKEGPKENKFKAAFSKIGKKKKDKQNPGENLGQANTQVQTFEPAGQMPNYPNQSNGQNYQYQGSFSNDPYGQGNQQANNYQYQQTFDQQRPYPNGQANPQFSNNNYQQNGTIEIQKANMGGGQNLSGYQQQPDYREYSPDQVIDFQSEAKEVPNTEIPPSYFGFEPVDDRQRKDHRHEQTFGNAYNPQSMEDMVARKVRANQAGEKSPQMENQPTNQADSLGRPNNDEAVSRQTFEPGQNNYQNISQPNPNQPYQNQQNPTYDDIPNEFIEARIARQIAGAEANNYGQNQYSQGSFNTPPTDPYYESNANRDHGNSEMAAAAGQMDYQQGQYQANGYQRDYQGYQVDPYQQNQYQNTNYQQGYQQDPYQQNGYQAQNAYTDPVVEEPMDDDGGEKKGFKFKPIYLLPIVLLIIGLVAGYLFMNRKPDDIELDLSEYIDVTYDGEEGSATPMASLNTSRILSDHANKIAYVNKSRKDEGYGSAANQFVEELARDTEFQFSKDGNLSNGEEITVVANVKDSTLADDYNVTFVSTMKPVIVEGLITQEYQDPFEYIDVTFDGESPNITLTASIKEDAPEYMSLVEINPSKTSELEAGEEVNVSLTYNEEDVFNSYGLRLNPTDKIFTVPGESEEELEEEEEEVTDDTEDALAGGYITSVDNLSEDLLGTLKEKSGELIRNTFSSRSYTQIGNIEYLGAITGSGTDGSEINNRVMLVYEIKANEDYEGKYTNEFTYFTFVEYQNVTDTRDENGKFYTEGPITTDNEIFHKFFVEDDYTYYEIPYYGFGFLEEVLTRVNNALSGLTIDDSIAVDVTQYFTTGDGVPGEYQGNGTRLSLRANGDLRYKLDQRIHQGKWQENGNNVTLTIQGVNVDTPINASFENGALNVSEQGEMKGQTFNKMQAMQ